MATHCCHNNTRIGAWLLSLLDEPQETARIIINTLKNLEYDGSAPFTSLRQKSKTSNEQLVNGQNKDLESDIFKATFSGDNSYRANVADMKPKRGWEDFSLIWRKSPKRAWEVVNKLWKNPVIRRKYKTYLENGKRSDELMEYIPVQQNNENPFWMIDEIGYNIDFDNPIVRNTAKESDIWPSQFSKRGWEVVNPAVWQKIVTSKRANFAGTGKRAWEDFNWKRDSGVHMRNNLFVPRNGAVEAASIFNPNVVKALEEETSLNQLKNLRPNFDILLPDYFNSGKDTRFNKLEKSGTGSNDEHDTFSKNFKEQIFPYNIQEYNEVLGENLQSGLVNDDISKAATFEHVCRMLLGDLAKCRNNPYLF